MSLPERFGRPAGMAHAVERVFDPWHRRFRILFKAEACCSFRWIPVSGLIG